MLKSIATLIDELVVTNLKIFYLVDKIQSGKHTAEDATKMQSLNSFRTELCNALNRRFGEKETVKV